MSEQDKKVKSVVELVAEQPNVDRTDAFEELWGIFGGLRKQVDSRFNLTMDPSTESLQPYHATDDSGAKGFLSAFSADDLDWFVHSWIGNPQYSFVNMHLTLWLPSTTRVPHLAYALATLPDIFFYMDFIPRVDLTTDTAYLDKYYQPMNDLSIEFRENPNMNWFFSRSLFVRQALSETALCYTCKYTPENMAMVQQAAQRMMNQWETWLDAGDPVPANEQAALAERDLAFRRTIAERDPANELGEKMFGKELTDRLVRALWGGDRKLPRLGVSN